MIGGKSNEKGKKTTRGLISEKATPHVQHTFCTFLWRCFARLQRETSRNFRVCSCSLFVCLFSFSLSLIFASVAASISHFLTAATKFSCRSSTKKKNCPLCFFSLVRAICGPFSRWASLACRLLSLFLCLSLSLYSKNSGQDLHGSPQKSSRILVRKSLRAFWRSLREFSWRSKL